MPAVDRIARRVTWQLSRANARSHALLTAALAAEGVRGYHLRLLAALDQNGPASQADLGRHTGIDRSDVVATVNDLVGRGFAEREPDPTDRRRNIITITQPGGLALGRLDEVLDAVQEAVLVPLTPSERRTFLRLLAKIT